MNTTYTKEQLKDLFTLAGVDNVRYEYATTKTKHSKKGKKTIQSGGAFFVLKFKNGIKISVAALVRLANELEDGDIDTKKARALEPFCRALISRAVINTTKRELLQKLNLPVSDELEKACKDEAAKAEERVKRRVDKILGIIEKGRVKYINSEGKRAREKAGERFDNWEMEYSGGARGASENE
jgi:molecular chaperone GrpE (heat shock protein)